MTKDEMKDKISMALKDPILQMGFEVICSKLSRLEKENAELQEKNSAMPVAYKYCAELEKQRRMTNKELSWWLSEKPHREYKYKVNGLVFRSLAYKEVKQNEEVRGDIVIREDDGEWREPLVEVAE